MKGTDEIIDGLVAGLAPVRRGDLRDRLLRGIGAGAAVSAVAMAATMGLRPDFGPAMATGPFWIKFAFTGLLAAAGGAAVARLARPDGSVRTAAILGGLVLCTMVVLAIGQFYQSAPTGQRRLLMGSSALVCPWIIGLLALPILVSGLWTMRMMAPTRLGLAGAAVGLLAGSVSAFIYAFACDESAMPFVTIWYGLGITGTTLLGAALGRSTLRW